jgi:ammonia channel protein AmtB
LIGTLAGLAGITPISGFVESWVALLMGFICGKNLKKKEYQML